MKLAWLEVKNYKSLRSVHLMPGPLTLIVGPNGAGKSNLADALDFIAEVYRHGLELAISRRGGFENIAFRRVRRSKQPVSVSTVVILEEDDLRGLLPERAARSRFSHSFSFAAKGYSIRAEFRIVAERLVLDLEHKGKWVNALEITRTAENRIKVERDLEGLKALPRSMARQLNLWSRLSRYEELSEADALPATDLLSTAMGRFFFGLGRFTQTLSSFRVFQIQPAKARDFGVPTPRPELDNNGANLPAVVDLLKKRKGRAWQEILSAMRALMPTLKDISVDYTTNRTLGLLFEETGTGRPWAASEISDGTLQALALLVALFDERSSGLMIEELENSLHPWVIRKLMAACRAASEHKQIILSSHSPVVMNEMQPSEIYVLWRENGASHLEALTALDQDFVNLWKSGQAATFDFLDSGAEPRAIPPAPVLE